MSEPKNRPLVLVGKIISAHGIRGQVKIKTFGDNPDDIFTYGMLTDNRGTQYSVNKKSSSGNVVIVNIEGVNSRSDAEKLRGTELFTSRDNLPELKSGQYYQTDLVGLKVVDVAGRDFGIVESFQNYGAGDLIEIKKISDGKSELYVFNKITFPEILPDKGIIKINPPEEVADNSN